MNKLAKIKDEITEDDILVIMDERSLYTDIPNDNGIQAVRDKLNNSPSGIPTGVQRSKVPANTNTPQTICTPKPHEEKYTLWRGLYV